MKKYFAKYLPVEGEPKEGDMVIYKEVGWTENYEEALKAAVYGDPIPIKVKLFLCSRDIQVGDEVHIPYPSGEVRIKPTEASIIAIGNVAAKNNGYKVVGEISPEATWVKEGDEFNEEEVKRVVCIANPFGETSWYDKPLDFIPELGVRNEHSYMYIATHIEIKCPTCRKFH
jgi:hypothetical protein